MGKASVVAKGKAKAKATIIENGKTGMGKGKVPMVVPKTKTKVMLGCSKCRGSPLGCAQCRDPSFGGKRFQKLPKKK